MQKLKQNDFFKITKSSSVWRYTIQLSIYWMTWFSWIRKENIRQNEIYAIKIIILATDKRSTGTWIHLEANTLWHWVIYLKKFHFWNSLKSSLVDYFNLRFWKLGISWVGIEYIFTIKSMHYISLLGSYNMKLYKFYIFHSGEINSWKKYVSKE